MLSCGFQLCAVKPCNLSLNKSFDIFCLFVNFSFETSLCNQLHFSVQPKFFSFRLFLHEAIRAIIMLILPVKNLVIYYLLRGKWEMIMLRLNTMIVTLFCCADICNTKLSLKHLITFTKKTVDKQDIFIYKFTHFCQ